MGLVSLDEIRLAAEVINEHVLVTPLIRSTSLNERGRLFLKAENLQITGSFKMRGAYNAVAKLVESTNLKGVITYSSGNHGNALAKSAWAYGIPCTVVMPEDAQSVKVTANRALGADVLLVPPAQRQTIAENMAISKGYALVPPFDHPDVIAGQGTIGLEIVEQLPEVDVVLTPIGGGALASGIAAALRAVAPGVAIIGVEPDLAADAADGLRKGHIVRWSPERRARTIADGLRTNLSDLTFHHLQEFVDEVLTVTEDQIYRAIRLLIEKIHLVAEPSGAVAFAGYIEHEERFKELNTVAVISGGNIDLALLESLYCKPIGTN
jgi:threonine dehydratase